MLSEANALQVGWGESALAAALQRQARPAPSASTPTLRRHAGGNGGPSGTSCSLDGSLPAAWQCRFSHAVGTRGFEDGRDRPPDHPLSLECHPRMLFSKLLDSERGVRIIRVRRSFGQYQHVLKETIRLVMRLSPSDSFVSSCPVKAKRRARMKMTCCLVADDVCTCLGYVSRMFAWSSTVRMRSRMICKRQ
jgi:hypothetical protein